MSARVSEQKYLKALPMILRLRCGASPRCAQGAYRNGRAFPVEKETADCLSQRCIVSRC